MLLCKKADVYIAVAPEKSTAYRYCTEAKEAQWLD